MGNSHRDCHIGKTLGPVPYATGGPERSHLLLRWGLSRADRRAAGGGCLCPAALPPPLQCLAQVSLSSLRRSKGSERT